MPTLPTDADIVQKITENSELFNLNAGQIFNRTRDQAAVSTKFAAEAEATGAQAAISSETAGRAKLAGDESIAALAKLLRVNAIDPNSIVPELTSTFLDSYEKSNKIRNIVSAGDNISFFDSPLDYIAWQTGGRDKVVGKYNTVAQEGNAAITVLQTLQQTQTQGAAAARASEKSTSEAKIAADAKIAAFEYRKLSAQAEYSALSYNVAGLKALQEGNKVYIEQANKLFEIRATLFGGELRASENNISLQRLQMAEKSFEFEKQSFEFRLKEAKNKLEGQEMLGATIVAGMGVLGLEKPSEANLSQMKFMFASGSNNKALKIFMDAGMNKILGGQNTIADTPGDAFLALQSVNPKFNESPRLQAGMKWIATELYEHIPAPNRAAAAKNPALMKEAINAAAIKDVPGMQANPEGNEIYRAPSLVEMSKFAPVVATPFYQTLLAGQVAAGKTEITAQDMFAQGFAAIQQKQLTIEEVANGIATYYKNGIQKSNLDNYVLGIPKQDKYPVKLSQTGILFNNSYDMSNATQVLAALLDAHKKAIGTSTRTQDEQGVQ